MKFSISLLAASLATADGSAWGNLRRHLSYEKVATYSPGSQVSSHTYTSCDICRWNASDTSYALEKINHCSTVSYAIGVKDSNWLVQCLHCIPNFRYHMIHHILISIFLHNHSFRLPITAPSTAINVPSKSNSHVRRTNHGKMPNRSTSKVVTPSHTPSSLSLSL